MFSSHSRSVETGARSLPGVPVEPPDLVDHVVAVGVEDVVPLVRVSREVELDDAVGRDGVEVRTGSSRG